VLIDEEARRMVREAYEFTDNLLRSKITELEKVAQTLLKDEVISQQQVRELIGDRPFPMDAHEENFVKSARAAAEHVVTEQPASDCSDDAPAGQSDSGQQQTQPEDFASQIERLIERLKHEMRDSDKKTKE
jgi:hypothetical protein